MSRTTSRPRRPRRSTSACCLTRTRIVCHGKGELVEQLKDIAANFQFNAYRPTNILVDGDRAAAELQLDLTSVSTGRRFSARIAHFWSFKGGVPTLLVEYMDTALIASESGAPSKVHGDA